MSGGPGPAPDDLPEERLLGMTREEFRTAGHALVDWIADFTGRLEDLPVVPDVAPGDLRAMLPAAPPEVGEPFDAILADLDRVVVPGLTNWQSPNWFAYFPTGASYPSVLADLLGAALGQQGMLWSSSPITTELEQHVLDWLVDLLGLPARFRSDGPGGGVLQMSASDSTHTALVVARERATREHGVPAHLQVAYSSTQAHSSIEKGARVAGYGHLRQVDVDDRFALRPDALAAAVAADRAAGLHPTFVCAAVGTTGTTACDPVRAVAELARAEGLWCHVDAAYAGAAMLLPECRHLQDGLELVDSYTWNPHKWFAVGFDCSVFHVADRRPLLEALSILPPYLRGAAGDGTAQVDYRDWHLPLGRRSRALKLWFVLRSYGVQGMQAMLREHLRLATWFDARVTADPRFEVIAPTVLGLVSFRHVAGDEATRALGDAINEDRGVLITPSEVELDGVPTAFLRVSIGATLTRARHVEALWNRVDAAA